MTSSTRSSVLSRNEPRGGLDCARPRRGSPGLDRALESTGKTSVRAANTRGAWLIQAAACEGGFTAIHNLAREIDSRETPQTHATVYVAGVYTDMKVQTLLVGLRTQYDLEGFQNSGFDLRRGLVILVNESAQSVAAV